MTEKNTGNSGGHAEQTAGNAAREVCGYHFTDAEKAYLDMLNDGGILVGERWFPKSTSELERIEYAAKQLRRDERNHRRRERYRERNAADGLSKDDGMRPNGGNRVSDRGVRTNGGERAYDGVGCSSGGSAKETARTISNRRRRIIPIDPASQRANRLPLERRKCIRRSTLAPCPSANELRTAWRFHNTSREAFVRLGGLLLDLDCYVDNSLITIVRRGLMKIVGRQRGLRGWIADNCEELAPHYKSLQRIKNEVKRLRQCAEVLDPVPVSVLLNPAVDPAALSGMEIHVQPRPGALQPVRDRFVWEKSPPIPDADGRTYFHNENYWLVNFPKPGVLAETLRTVRDAFRQAIILKRPENRTVENYSMGDGRVVVPVRGRMTVMDMIRDIENDPHIMVDVGKDMIDGLARGLKEAAEEVVLPSRTLDRKRRGEPTSFLQYLDDFCSGYQDITAGMMLHRSVKPYNAPRSSMEE